MEYTPFPNSSLLRWHKEGLEENLQKLADVLNELQNYRVEKYDETTPDLEVEKDDGVVYERVHSLFGYVQSIDNGPWTVFVKGNEECPNT